ncbi:MAG: DNA-binding protein WhiA [Firmicutes bacterium]|nr:DNA-binding protein WhiA [Bacillota bacterium]
MDSFSQRTKAELARRFPKKKCCMKAELAAIIRASGSLHLRANHAVVLSVSSENAAFMRKVHLLLKDYFQIPSRIIMEKTGRLNRRYYKLQLFGGKNVKRVLTELDVLSPGLDFESGISSALVRTDCCRAAFLRGAFLARGSVTDPQKNSYHLEIVTENEEFALGLNYLMNLCRFKAGLTQRKEYLVYLKEADAIGKFLTFIGAHAAFLRMEDVRIIKGMRNEVNRLVNCETANLGKAVRAAMEQVEVINALKAKGVLAKLPVPLQELAYLRLEHPEASLRELGELSTPPLSKSAVNHRMRKMLKIAETFLGREGKESSKLKD